jgi:isopropylmalate/homocitrate/citramalate synthase
VTFVLKRTLLLREHADAVLEVRERAAHVRAEMIAHEVRIMVMDGLSPRAAEAARNDLALRLRELDYELLTELARLQDEFHRRVARLLENLHDDRSGSLTG